MKSYNPLFFQLQPGGIYLVKDLMFTVKADHAAKMKGASPEPNEIYANIDSIDGIAKCNYHQEKDKP